MKITFIKSDLSDAISKVIRAVSSKSSIPALEGILLSARNKKLTLTGYDLEIGIKAVINEVIIQEEGEIVFPARLLSDLVKRSKDVKITLESDEKYVTKITSGKSKFKIVGLSPDDYPDLPNVTEKETFSLPGETLKRLISQTNYAVSDNNAKPIYTGSLFEIENRELTVCAIDGFQMAISKETIDSGINTSFVLPGKTEKILSSIVPDKDKINVSVDNRFISFAVDNYSVYSRLIEGTFLDYKSTLPSETNTKVKLKSEELLYALERFNLIENDKVKSPVRLTVKDDLINLKVKTALASADDEVVAKVEGENVEIGFNISYLINGLKAIDSDEVVLSLKGALSPMTITPTEGDSQLALVVPMRLADK